MQILLLLLQMQLPSGYSSNARLKEIQLIRHFISMTQGHYLRLLMNGELLQVLSMKVLGKEDHINGSICSRKKSDGTYCLHIKKYRSMMAGSDGTYIHDKSGSTQLCLGIHHGHNPYPIWKVTFGQDMNGDGSIGVDTSTLTDYNNWHYWKSLKKDADGAIYITDSDGNNPLAITDPYGGSPSLEWESSWTEGSYKSEAIAVTLIDDTVDYYNLAVKNTIHMALKPI